MADEQPRGIDHTDSIDSNDGPKQPDKKKSRRPASECASRMRIIYAEYAQYGIELILIDVS
jgi:hypothetical protein